MTRFVEKLNKLFDKDRRVCLGLDPDYKKLPSCVQTFSRLGDDDLNQDQAISADIAQFCKNIIDASRDIVAAYKPNTAFFESYGQYGVQALAEVVRHIHNVAPHVPIIIDGKRADIGATNEHYAHLLFEYLEADAITVHPYLGYQALEPFLRYHDRTVFVLCRTSNPGAGEFQDLRLIEDGRSQLLYEKVAQSVANPSTWNKNSNCGLVVGATYPDELGRVRSLAPQLPILIPGVGTQDGDINAAVKSGMDARGRGYLINVGSAALYASSGADFAQVASAYVQNVTASILHTERSA